MADRKRAELAESVKDACEGLQECGFQGLLEAPVTKMFTDLHKLHDTEQLSKLLADLEGAATRLISAKAAPAFPELMVCAQLLRDVEGPAAPPEGSDSPLDSDFKSVATNLRLALCTSLAQFARPGSTEAKEGLELATGMLLMLHEKVEGDPLVALAVEHGLLRLLSRRRACVMMLREKQWSLAALNKQVAALADYDPAKDPNAEVVYGEDLPRSEDEDEDDDAYVEEDEEVQEEEEAEADEAEAE